MGVARRRRGILVAGLWVVALAGCQGEGQGPLGSLLGTFIEPLQPESPRELAVQLFDVTDADNRRKAIALFSSASFGGAEVYVKWYRLMLGGSSESPTRIVSPPDHDATVRSASVRALGIHGDVDDVKLIIPLLDDEVAFVRWEAAKALGKIHHPSTVRPLLRKLREETALDPDGVPVEQLERRGDPDPDVRKACAVALGQYATPAVFDGLVSALTDSDFGVAHAARQSLKTLTGFDIGPEPSDWLIWEKRHRGKLFKNQQEYTWQPFESPPSLLDKMQFWKTTKPIPRRVPTGFEAGADAKSGRS